MSQFRTFEFRADDSTFELNQRLLGLIVPGVYRGFDWSQQAGLNFILTHAISGTQYYDKNELLSDPLGVLVTKQGITIKESENIILGIDPGSSNPRWDAIVVEHYYSEVTGGTPGVYMVIKGTPAVTPVKPSLTNPSRQLLIGYLYVPASMASLSEGGVLFQKQVIPDWSNNGFRARLDSIESINTNQDTELANRLKISLNGSDIANKSTFRTNLQLGNHVTYNFAGSGGNYGVATNIARGDHAHSGVYEPVFTKNTAFNKNFGSASSTVCQGNDSRLSDSRRCNNTFDSATTSRTNLGLGNHVTYNFAGSGGTYGAANSLARGDHKHSGSDITEGSINSDRIPNLSYDKITSGHARLYGYMHTRGYRISYDGEYGGIYIRSDGNLAIGETSGASDRKLYVNGSFYARDNDTADGSSTTGVGHSFFGRGKYGSYPHIVWIATSGLTLDADTDIRALNIQLPVWNTVANRYHWMYLMNAHGGIAGSISNSTHIGGYGPGIEIWGHVANHSPSDMRLKDNIEDTKYGINDIMKFKVKDFNFKGNKEKRMGMIAQELDEVMPEYVDKPEGQFMSIQYDRLIPLLIKSIQDLKNEIESLKN